MKNYKKVLALLLAGAMTASLAACGGGGGTADSTGGGDSSGEIHQEKHKSLFGMQWAVLTVKQCRKWLMILMHLRMKLKSALSIRVHTMIRLQN